MHLCLNSPAPLGKGYYDTPGTAYTVQVVGTYAYVADGSSGLRIIDVSNPLAPIPKGSYDTPGNALGVQVIGTCAYVSDGTYGLELFDVSNPASPVLKNTYDTPGIATAVQVVDNLAYVADGDSGLRIINVQQFAPQVSQIDATTFRVQLAPWVGEGKYAVSIGPSIADLAGNTMDKDADGIGGESHDVYTFTLTVDKTLPTAPSSLSFTDDTGSSGDAITADTELVFTWGTASDDIGLNRYEYRLDGGDWTATPTSPRSATRTVTEGSHLFEVRAVDKAGNAGPVKEKSFTVDLTPPSAPANLKLDGAVLTWSAGTDENGVWKHQYSIDGGAWTDATGTSVATALADGTTHEFAVRAIDKAGNVGDVASATMTVDYGPRISSYGPGTMIGPGNDHVDLTFNEAVDPTTFTVDDVITMGEVGYYDTLGNAYSVQIVGNLAYVADDTYGLRIINVSNPAAPLQVGYYDTPGYARGVQIVGSLAYVADDTYGLRIINVSNPASPGQVGYYDTPGYARGVQIVGSLAYVADVSYGLQIIDVSNPGTPALKGSYDTPGTAVGVQVVGSLAYVADGTSGLRMIDVSNPAAPAEIGCWNTPGTSWNVQVVGNLVYVADYGSGLRIVQTSQAVQSVTQVDATTFRVEFQSSMMGGVHQVYVGPAITDLAGSTMDQNADGVITFTPADVFVFSVTVDWTPPTTPGALAISEDTGSAGDGVTTVGEQIISWSAASDANGIARYEYRLDGGYWQATTELTATFAGLEEDVHLFEIRAWDNAGNVSQTASKQFTVDLTAPSAPGDLRLDGTVLKWSPATDANGLWEYQYRIDGGAWTNASGTSAATGLADAAAASFEVQALDKAGNVGPAVSAALTVAYGPHVVSVTPAGPSNAGYVDVTFSKPIAPGSFTADDLWFKLQPLGSVGGAPGLAYDVDVAGNLAYVADYLYGLRIIDVSDPAAPTEVSRCDLLTNLYRIQVVGSLAYLGTGSGLRIVDVSDPAAPKQVGSCNTPSYAYGIQVVGNLAYVAGYSAGLQIIDVSDPAKPKEVGSCSTPTYACDVCLAGNYAYVANYSAGLRIIDVSDPAKPAEVGYYDTPGYAYGVQMVGNLAYVADYTYGLRIIDVSDLAEPKGAGYFDTPGSTYDVQVVGSTAYVADYAAGLQIIDISNSAAPVLIDQYDTPNLTRKLDVVGDLVYLADRDGGLRIVRVDQPVQGIDQIDAVTYRVLLSEPMAQGSRQIQIRPHITDLAGNTMDQDADGVGGEGADDTYAFTITIDTTPPTAPGGLAFTDDTGPAGDGVTTDTQPAFTWIAATDANGIARYEYRLGGGDWTATAELSAAMAVPLAEGAHTFEVRAVDNAGNAGPTAVKQITVDLTAPGALAGVINAGQAQRTKIASIKASFDEAVVCDAGALTITDAATGQPVDISAAAYDLASRTWNLSAVNLPDGYYTARIAAAGVQDLAGNAMAADYTFTFYKLQGDTTGDGCVDAADYIALKRNIGRSGAAAWSGGDLDGDGYVGWNDLMATMGCMGTSLGAPPQAAPAGGESSLAGTPAAQMDSAQPDAPNASDSVAAPALATREDDSASAEPASPIAPATDNGESDVLAIAASLFDSRLSIDPRCKAGRAVGPANTLSAKLLAVRLRPVSALALPSPRFGRAGLECGDPLELARPWRSDDSVGRDTPGEPLTISALDIAARLHRDRLEHITLDVLAARRP